MKVAGPVVELPKKLVLKLTHCCKLEIGVVTGAVTTKPVEMKATVTCGLDSVRFCEPLIPMKAVIWVGTKLLETPSWQAFARMLVRRMVRVPAVPGASIGTPSQVTEFAAACRAT